MTKGKKQLLLEEAWKTALDKPVPCTFATRAGAIRARMALYNAVRKAKKGEDPDIRLCQAAESVEVSWTSETSFVLRRIDQSDFIQGLEAALGKPMQTFEDPDAAESLRKVQEQLGKGQAEGLEEVPNPFFKRER